MPTAMEWMMAEVAAVSDLKLTSESTDETAATPLDAPTQLTEGEAGLWGLGEEAGRVKGDGR